MVRSISKVSLSRLSEFVASHLGLRFPPDRWNDLERGIHSAAEEFGFKDAEPCIDWLISSQLVMKQIEILASHLTVGETYFFREQRSFEILEQQLLPELIGARRGGEQSIRIWSAGCCTGEEPYSIAMLLSRMIPDLEQWNITILATDLNPRSLQKATEGDYSEWSFRSTPQWVKEKYFGLTKKRRWAIKPHISEMVTFDYLNLAEDVYPSLLNNTNAMDVIFCRNVLMYFTPDAGKMVVRNLFRALVNGGWLIVSPSETSGALFSQFATVNFAGATLYRRTSYQPATAEKSSTGIGDERKVLFHQNLTVASDLNSVIGPLEQVSKQPPVITAGKDQSQAEPNPNRDAATLYEQGRYAEAAELLTPSFCQDQKDTNVMALLARAYANQGRLSEAYEWCEKAIDADKLNAGYCYLRATILQEQGLFGEARTSLKRALYLDQNFVLAHFALGNLTLREGKVKESGKHFANALSLLKAYRREEILPESEGITAGRLMEIIILRSDHGSSGLDRG